MKRFRVGIDIGGTFTDLVYFDEHSGEFFSLKVLTTPKRPAIGALAAIRKAGIKFYEINMIVHATTLGTNMFLGQEGLELPKVGLITTKGFRDVIEIGRQRRPELYNLFFDKPTPLIPRRDRYEVIERISAEGKVLVPIDPDEIKKLAFDLCKKGYEVIAVSFLHSYLNPQHEIMVKRIIKKICPKIDVITSYEIDPEEREYERTSTTIINAFLKPLLSRYLTEFLNLLKNEGFTGKLLLMQSSGGVSEVESAIERPAAFIESGPAAGAMATAYYSRIIGDEKVIGFDMGGTTAKASTIINGEPSITTEYEIGGRIHAGRLIKGSGYPVRFPFIDLAEVSAGGGTIAWIDEGGALKVGPKSAGADPGPACYGKGGHEPTVTDANFILGRLSEKLAGGEVILKKELAEGVIKKLADSLGSEVEEIAYGIIRIVNTLMAKALRIVTVERGYDPREFTLYVFGGAGPLHGAELAEELNINSILIPKYPGTFSALGLLLSDYRIDRVLSILKTIDKINSEYINNLYENLEKSVLNIFERNVEVKIIRQADLRYKGQAYELTVPWQGTIEECVKTFNEKHEALYGFKSPDEPIEFVNVRVTVIGRLPKPRITRGNFIEHHAHHDDVREVYFGDHGWLKTKVYVREKLKPGAYVEGPAVIEESDSTTLVPPRYIAVVDEYYNIRMEVD